MIDRLKRYLKFRREFRNEWCVCLLEHFPFRLYWFAKPDDPNASYGWEGSHSGVKFDPYYIYGLEDDYSGDYSGIAGFYHTHPPHLGKAQPSDIDITTMDAWVLCLGRPLFCWIDNGWDIACWYFDQYGYFRMSQLEPQNDPLKDERIFTKGK